MPSLESEMPSPCSGLPPCQIEACAWHRWRVQLPHFAGHTTIRGCKGGHQLWPILSVKLLLQLLHIHAWVWRGMLFLPLLL